MQAYENTFFGIRLEFPDSWSVTSWKNSDLSAESCSNYQLRDDDLPANVLQQNTAVGENQTDAISVPKFLFIARRYTSGTFGYVDADIETALLRVNSHVSVHETIKLNLEREDAYYKKNGILREITGHGTWSVSGLVFDYVDERSQSQHLQSYYRFAQRHVDESLCLYAKIAGHQKTYFDEAIGIFESLTWNQTSTGCV